MPRLFVALYLFSCTFVVAQTSFFFDQSVSVRSAEGNPIPLAWTGGLNSTQYNTMDLNRDGKDDLVLFDRMAKKVITFLNVNNSWQYAPQYEFHFPTITNWLVLRDYNCDGKKDVFTGDALGIKVYLNTQSGALPSWKQLKFYSSPGSKSDVILTKGFTGKINIQLQYDDLPSIIDADGDGDLDIFNMRLVGGTIELHKNLSIEKYSSCDSLEFERVTQAWGGVKDCYCGTFAFNDADCSSGGRLKHTGGKSLLFFDGNNDQRSDMLFSEAECSSIFQLQNDGTVYSPVINKSSAFPANDPVDFVSYPAAYFEDVDFDGKKDLMVSSNNFFKDELESDLANSNIFFKNSGTNLSPILTRVQNNFLQDQMIDVGDNSVPAFADADGDGDYDMFISSNSSDEETSRISFFENSGTEEAPLFQLVTDDYFHLSATRFYNVKIQFVDVNGDNALDLAFTASNLDKTGTKLFYVLNKSQFALDLSNQDAIETEFALNSSENAYLVDVDLDGKVDLLAGKNTGQLELWMNSGTTPPKFLLSDDDYLHLNTTGFNQNISTYITDIDNDGTRDLVYSDGNGKLHLITDFHGKTNADTKIDGFVINGLTNQAVDPNIGIQSFVTVVNLFNTAKPSLVLGSRLGGVTLLKNSDEQPLDDDPTVDVFPNPANSQKTLSIRADRSARVEIISAVGKRVHDDLALQAHQLYQYQFTTLQAGVYFLKFHLHDQTIVKRVVLY